VGMRSNRRTPVLHKGGPREGGSEAFQFRGAAEPKVLSFTIIN
jgi:hypothetical protein